MSATNRSNLRPMSFPGLSRILFLIVLLVFSAAVSAAEKPLTFGVVPQQSASKLAKVWGPVMAHVSKQTGIKLRFKTAPNIPEFEKRLLNGEYDFAYMNPYHYVVFSKTPGYQALGKARDKKIKGILVTLKESDINDIKQLDGKVLAFPSPAAFAASILPQAELKKANISIEPKYVSSHDSVYRNVAKGIYPAGGGVKRTFNAVSTEVSDKLRVLWTSKGYTPHAIAAHPDVDAEVAREVMTALVDMENSEDSLSLLTNKLKIKGWEYATDSDWDDVRGLQLETLDALTQ